MLGRSWRSAGALCFHRTSNNMESTQPLIRERKGAQRQDTVNISLPYSPAMGALDLLCLTERPLAVWCVCGALSGRRHPLWSILWGDSVAPYAPISGQDPRPHSASASSQTSCIFSFHMILARSSYLAYIRSKVTARWCTELIHNPLLTEPCALINLWIKRRKTVRQGSLISPNQIHSDLHGFVCVSNIEGVLDGMEGLSELDCICMMCGGVSVESSKAWYRLEFSVA